jgi:hypothetical protein
MKRLSMFKSVVLASGVAAVLMASATPALAEAPALTPALVSAHQGDLEAMLADLAKVKSPETAKAYEGYLSGQMPKYIANHKALHQGPMHAFKTGGMKRGWNMNEKKLAEATEKLNETHYPRLAVELDRVEKLNPGLKVKFDELRSLE